MSLVCTECDRDMGPSKKLPGHDGVMVSPVLLAMAWQPESGAPAWKLRHVLAANKHSLCFRCISKQVKPEQKPALKIFYELLDLETRRTALERQSVGKWRSLADPDPVGDALHALVEKAQQFDSNACLLCGECSRKPHEPFFVAFVLDRAYCQGNLTQWMGSENYSFTDLKCGETSCLMCYSCMREKFPRLFRGIGNDLCGLESDPPLTGTGPLIYMRDDVVAALEKEIGAAEAARRLKEMGVKIIGPTQN